jgi:hypothetical protein
VFWRDFDCIRQLTNLAENETSQTNLAAARPLKNAASSAGGYRLLPLYLILLLFPNLE